MFGEESVLREECMNGKQTSWVQNWHFREIYCGCVGQLFAAVACFDDYFVNA